MTPRTRLVLAITLALTVAGSAWAQTPAEHAQHHAGAPAVPASSARKAAPAPRPGSADRMAAMDDKMKAMREMHEKMMGAKSPEERNGMMGEHMKMMQDGMAAMNMMGSGAMGGGMGMGGMPAKRPMPQAMEERQQMMEKRMDMMQSMMQLMMDRLPAPPAK